MKAGFIGLGCMGAPMAQNVYQKDGSIVLYNRSTDIYAQFTGTGVTIAKDAGDVAKQTDIIFLSLPGPLQVEEIGQILIDNGKEGQIIVDLSTVSPQVNMKLVAAAKEKGHGLYRCACQRWTGRGKERHAVTDDRRNAGRS